MSQAFAIGAAKRKHDEATRAFRFLGDQTTSLYEEAAYVWSDNNGMAFAMQYMQPQADEMQRAHLMLARQVDLMASAERDAEDAERAASLVHAKIDEAEHAQTEAERHMREAEEMSGHALDNASRARSESETARANLNGLGSPPI